MQIVQSFLSVEPHLMGRGKTTDKKIGTQGNSECFGHGIGQLLTLIESTFPQSRWMQRHWHNGIRTGEVKTDLCQKVPKKIECNRIGAEFTPQKQILQCIRIDSITTEMIPRGRDCQTVSAWTLRCIGNGLKPSAARAVARCSGT